MSIGEEQFIARAIDLAIRNVHDGGGPFGAVIVTGDGRPFDGTNRVTANNDPTAHAEVMAIRNACSSLGTFDLSGCVLYTSCEPCPLCLSAALWARVDGIVYAADRHDAARAGFDDARFHDFFTQPVEERSMQVRQLVLPDSSGANPFRAWAELANRIEY
ncbi:nucleoside deaminase [Arthrobacter parietis]|uniref:Nucleoside deaminase n=1 Tax=Arthrobacter parietis TaxID=271434 RepID=A0ABP5MGI6_9MICC